MRILLLVGFSILWMSSVYAQEICDNAIDDDADGLIDLNDDECECEPLVLDSVISLIPNSSFEQYDCLPFTYSQMDCATNWIQASGATSDYFHLDGFYNGAYAGIPTVPMPIPDGDGFVGFADAAYFGYYYPGSLPYKEYIGACLSAPLLTDTTYTFNFNIGFGTPNAAYYGYYTIISDTINLGFYASTDCANLPFDSGTYGNGCPTDYPGWEELGTLTMWGTSEWVEGTFTFTPTQDYNALVIGPDCNVNFDPEVGYFFLDDLTVNETSLFTEAVVTGEQLSCFEYLLELENNDNLDVQWYYNGVAISGQTADMLLLYAPLSGAYSATFTDGISCSVSNGYIVSNNSALIDFTFSGDFDICDGESTTISVAGNFEGIDWDGQDVTSVTYTTSEVVPITFTDSLGCTTDTSIAITVSPPISFDFSGDFDICPGETTTITVAGNFDSISWDGSNQTSVTYSYPQTDIITFTDAQGCSIDTTISISIAPDLSYNFTGDFEFCEGESTTISVAGTYDNIIWNGSPVTEVTYSDSQSDLITFTDPAGCSLDTTIQITEYPIPELEVLQGNLIVLDEGEQLGLSINTSSTDYTITWTPAGGLSCSDCDTPIVTGISDVSYTASIVDNESGCTNLVNLEVQVLTEEPEICEIWVPNSFTPNGDGANDTFGIYAPQNCVDEYIVFQIYNRWGERIFSSSSQDMNIAAQWDGKYKDVNLNSGVFVWQAAVRYVNGDESFYKGNVTLIR